MSASDRNSPFQSNFQMKVDISHLRALSSSDEEDEAFELPPPPPPVTRVVRPTAAVSTQSSGTASDVDTSQHDSSLDRKKHKKKKKDKKHREKDRGEGVDANGVKEEPKSDTPKSDTDDMAKKEKKSKKRAKKERESAAADANSRPAAKAHSMSSSEDEMTQPETKPIVSEGGGVLGFIDRGPGTGTALLTDPAAPRKSKSATSASDKSHSEGSQKKQKKKHKKKSRDERETASSKEGDGAADSDSSLPALDTSMPRLAVDQSRVDSDPERVRSGSIPTPTPADWTDEKRHMIEKRLERFDSPGILILTEEEKRLILEQRRERLGSPPERPVSSAVSPNKKRKKEKTVSPARKRKHTSPDRASPARAHKSPVSSPKKARLEKQQAESVEGTVGPLSSQTQSAKKRLSLSKKKKNEPPPDGDAKPGKAKALFPSTSSEEFKYPVQSSPSKKVKSPKRSKSSKKALSPKKTAALVSPVTSPIRDLVDHGNAAAGSDTSDSGPDDDDGSNQWGLTASQELFQSQSKWGSAGAPLQAKARGSETKRKKSKEKKSKQKDHVEEAVDKDDDESEKESADEEVAPASDKFRCPPGFVEVSLEHSKLWAEDAVGKQLWLIRAPELSDALLLDGKKIMLSGRLGFHREKDPKDESITIEWETNAMPDEGLQKSNTVAVLPSKKTKMLQPVGPFHGQILVTKSEPARPYVVPDPTPRPTPRLPDNLKYRLTPFGCGQKQISDDDQVSSQNQHSQKEKKKKKKKDKHREKAENTAEVKEEPVTSDALPEHKKKKKKKSKHKDESDTDSKPSQDLGESYIMKSEVEESYSAEEEAPVKTKKKKRKKSEGESVNAPDPAVDVNGNDVTEDLSPPSKKKKKKHKKEKE